MCRCVHISKKLVGYANKTCAANKFVQIALQFENVADGILKADDVLSGIAGVSVEGNWEATASQIQVVGTDGNPTKYYYLSDGYYEASPGNWKNKAGWCDGSGLIADLTLAPGQGVWLWTKGAEDQVMVGSGAVSSAQEVPVTAPEGIFSINGGVYPTTLNLNDPEQVTVNDGIGVSVEGNWESTAAQIQIVGTDGNPIKYYYLSDGYYEVSPDNWKNKAGWCDGSGLIADPIIQPQGAFWVWAKTGAITFTYKMK